MKTKQALPVYEIVTRSAGVERPILTTCRKSAAQKMYNQMLNEGSYPRLKMDGRDVPMMAADRIMRTGPTPIAGALKTNKPKTQRKNHNDTN